MSEPADSLEPIRIPLTPWTQARFQAFRDARRVLKARLRATLGDESESTGQMSAFRELELIDLREAEMFVGIVGQVCDTSVIADWIVRLNPAEIVLTPPGSQRPPRIASAVNTGDGVKHPDSIAADLAWRFAGHTALPVQ